MLQFIQSIWLWAAAAIIVPVIIHLWNVKRGKTLKVGSIALFAESAQSHASSVKLSQLLLLLLRCLLLIVLAMLLAKPFYVRRLNAQKEKGWILIEKQHVHEAYNNFKQTIDPLIKSGYSFHYFTDGFKEANLENLLKLREDTGKEPDISYWALLKALDQIVPPELPVYLFTGNSINRFGGSRPRLGLHLNWKTFTPRDSTAVWLEKAYATAPDSIHVITGNSSAAGTYFTHHNIAATGVTDAFTVKTADGKTFVANKLSDNVVGADIGVLSITIYTEKYTTDAAYLIAAINAIKDFTGYRIKVSLVNNVQHIPDQSSWLFWLADDTIPVSKIKSNVFVYEKGKVANVHAQLLTDDRLAVTENEDIFLYRLIQHNPLRKNVDQTIWADGFGDAILSVKKPGNIYHFYSRFDPQWNDLTWSRQFPQLIFNLLFNHKNQVSINGADKRIIDTVQIQPVIDTKKIFLHKSNPADAHDLSKIFWMIGLALFVAERMLSFNTNREAANG